MLRILSRYATNAAKAIDWQTQLETFSDSNEFPYTTYALAATDCDGFLWVKVGRSYDPVGRIGNYGYPAHFREFDIEEIIGIGVVGWETLEESVHAERYIHAQLHGFRYDAREWFTNWNKDVPTNDFINLLKFYWRSLSCVGATVSIEEDGIYLVPGGKGFPINLVSYHRNSLPKLA